MNNLTPCIAEGIGTFAVSFWDAHHVYWIRPLLGGAAAGWMYSKFLLGKS